MHTYAYIFICTTCPTVSHAPHAPDESFGTAVLTCHCTEGAISEHAGVHLDKQIVCEYPYVNNRTFIIVFEKHNKVVRVLITNGILVIVCDESHVNNGVYNLT